MPIAPCVDVDTPSCRPLEVWLLAPDRRSGENGAMNESRGGRWRDGAVVLFVGAGVLGAIATVASFDRELDIVLIPWILSMSASFIGIGLTALAILSLVQSEYDRLDFHSFAAALLLLVGAPLTTGWSGVAAAALVVTGWTLARTGVRRHRNAWRDGFVERREFLSSLRRADPRDADARRFVADPEIHPGLEDESPIPPTDGDYAATRGELKKRAREIDQDPWGQPPG